MRAPEQERTIECLKYFYGCFPLGPAGQPRERATRLIRALTDQQQQLRQLKERLPKDQPDINLKMLERINPLLDMIGAAMHQWDTVAAK